MEQEGINSPEDKEKLPSGHLLIVDDVYAERISNFFKSEDEKSGKENEIEAFDNLDSALERIRSIEDSRGIGVLTDMYMIPKEITSKDIATGLEIVGEICKFYGEDSAMVDQDIREAQKILEKDPSGGSYFTEENLQKIFNVEKYQKIGVVQANTVNDFYFGEEIRNGKNFIDSLPFCLTGGEVVNGGYVRWVGGFIYGIKIVEEAFKKKIPCVVVSGAHHAIPDRALDFIAKYLADRGWVNNSNVGHFGGDISSIEIFDRNRDKILKESTQEEVNYFPVYKMEGKSYLGDDECNEESKIKSEKSINMIRESLENQIRKANY